MTRVLDLRPGSTSCTDHPMVRFLNVLNRGEDAELVVVARREDMPVGVLRMVASRSGYEVVEVRFEEAHYEALLRKREASTV